MSGSAPSVKEVLDLAAISIRQGDLAEGKAGLDWVIQRDPENVLAWLWMSRCVKTPQEKLACYQKVLAIDPSNEHAQKGISILRQQKQARGGSPGKRRRTWVLLAILALVGVGVALVALSRFGVPNHRSGVGLGTLAANALAGSGMSAEEEKAYSIELVRPLVNSFINGAGQGVTEFVDYMGRAQFGYSVLTEVTPLIDQRWASEQTSAGHYSVRLTLKYFVDCASKSSEECSFAEGVGSYVLDGPCWHGEPAIFTVIMDEKAVLPQNECARTLTSK